MRKMCVLLIFIQLRLTEGDTHMGYSIINTVCKEADLNTHTSPLLCERAVAPEGFFQKRDVNPKPAHGILSML